ncbi:uncharacterized protein LOC124998005 [Mugil cephalus]|uniref:uncharacterized protein LOC124998005 n=1 Tax=Mugil cephalus TaxID=48193 RepID=UPI001FB600D1|nr:uncharacterized protein LOC124998005 [Mugil cephalus]
MTATVSMSGVWLKLVTIVCLSYTVLTGAEIKGVVWKKLGEAITIQCRFENQKNMSLKMGLNGSLVLKKCSQTETVGNQFHGRLVSNVAFSNMDILIKNLTSKDTGPYWCEYNMCDKEAKDTKTMNGTGSILLVVTDDRHTTTDAVHGCESSHQKLVLVSVVIAAAVLLGIIMAFFIRIILKAKHLCTTVKPRRVTTNDVYEDMRGTLRR